MMDYTTRINKIIGQLQGLSRLTRETDMSCDQILQQVNAIQGAVSSLKYRIIDDSFEVCIESKDIKTETKKLLSNIRRYT